MKLPTALPADLDGSDAALRRPSVARGVPVVADDTLTQALTILQHAGAS
ncbi:MAG: hypothetical protein H7288_19340 [Kineosporiaceae bacterium]|nr:hypothetical protein [Aeromicrobium sp.]